MYRLTATDIVIRIADQVLIPADPLNVDRATYDRWLAEGGVPEPYVPPPLGPYVLSKLQITRRLDDAELAQAEAAMGSAPLRLQVEWRNAQDVRSDDPSFPALQAFFEGLFGAARAAVILARP